MIWCNLLDCWSDSVDTTTILAATSFLLFCRCLTMCTSLSLSLFWNINIKFYMCPLCHKRESTNNSSAAYCSWKADVCVAGLAEDSSESGKKMNQTRYSCPRQLGHNLIGFSKWFGKQLSKWWWNLFECSIELKYSIKIT